MILKIKGTLTDNSAYPFRALRSIPKKMVKDDYDNLFQVCGELKKDIWAVSL